MNNNALRLLSILLFIAFLVFLGWYFSRILIYIFLAMALTIIGTPVVRLFSMIRIKGKKIPTALSAAFALVLILAVLSLFVYLMVPLITREFRSLYDIDPAVITDALGEWLAKADIFLKQQGVLSPRESLPVIVTGYLKSLVLHLNFGNIFGETIHMVGALFVGAFSVIFMTYFSLKDNGIFFKMVEKVIPISYRKSYNHILSATKTQLIRYFSGVLIEMVIIGTTEGLLAYLLGLPNPILIGFIGGLLNIIPYIGPLMALIISIIISITAIIPADPVQADLIWLVVKIVIVFIASKSLDDFILQPFIYGKSVHAHPLEIFVVILCAAQIGGIVGMILAVPAYSLLRIVFKEFFGEYYFREKDPDADKTEKIIPVVLTEEKSAEEE